MLNTGTQGFEQRYALYSSIYLYCGIAALILLLITIILFLVLKIPRVFGELTGRTARKAVEEGSVGKMAQRKKTSVRKRTDRGKAGGQSKEVRTVAASMQENHQVYKDLVGENDTPLTLVTQDDVPTPSLMPLKDSTYTGGDAETSRLEEAMIETTALNRNAEKSFDESETGLLDQNDMETTFLREHIASQDDMEAKFIVVRSIVEIHTDEMI